MAVVDNRTTKEIYETAIEVKTDKGIGLKNNITGRFLPGDYRKLKRKPVNVQANSSARTIMAKLKKLHSDHGAAALEQMILEQPKQFYDIWIKLIVFYGNGGQQPAPAAADHGQALLSAFQSGRLSEQLAALVHAGQHEVDRLQAAADQQGQQQQQPTGHDSAGNNAV